MYFNVKNLGAGPIPTSRSSGAAGGAQANNPGPNSASNMSGMMSLDSLMIEPQQNSGASGTVGGATGSSTITAAGRTARYAYFFIAILFFIWGKLFLFL